MRLLLAVALALAPVAADAQSDRSAPHAQPPASTLPPIGLPLAPIGLPLAPIGLGPPVTQTGPVSAQRQRSRRGRSGEPGHRRGARNGAVYLVPSYVWGLPVVAMPGVTAAAAPSVAPDLPGAATLWIDAEPRDLAEIHVDGYFVGTAHDRNPVVLEPGRHRVEIRAAGYEPQSADLRADPGGTLTLRRTLRAVDASPPPAPPEPAPAPPPVPRKPFYFIPGCYLGDVPPESAGLPPRCDPATAVVVRP